MILSKQIIEGFIKSKNLSEKDLIEKNTEKGRFYFIRTHSKSILVEDLLKKIIPRTIGSISWKKSMKWSEYNLLWGRPLRSIFARFNNKKLSFKFDHLETTDEIIIEQDLVIQTKKIKDSKEYFNFLKSHKIFVNHKEREEIILKKSAHYVNLNNTKKILTLDF